MFLMKEEAMTEKMIIDAYCRIRTIDQSIPDDVLDFMKNAAIEKLHQMQHDAKLPVTGNSFNDFDAECNECDWKGNKEDMADVIDEYGEFETVCPECGSSNVYYFR